MGIFKFLWIIAIFYFLYYLVVYLIERSKVWKATANVGSASFEYVVDTEQHQPVSVVAPREEVLEVIEEEQPDVDEKKKL